MMNSFRIQKSVQKIPFYMEAARSGPKESQMSLIFRKKGSEVHFSFFFLMLSWQLGKTMKNKCPKILNELYSIFFSFLVLKNALKIFCIIALLKIT